MEGTEDAVPELSSDDVQMEIWGMRAYYQFYIPIPRSLRKAKAIRVTVKSKAGRIYSGLIPKGPWVWPKRLTIPCTEQGDVLWGRYKSQLKLVNDMDDPSLPTIKAKTLHSRMTDVGKSYYYRVCIPESMKKFEAIRIVVVSPKGKEITGKLIKTKSEWPKSFQVKSDRTGERLTGDNAVFFSE